MMKKAYKMKRAYKDDVFLNIAKEYASLSTCRVRNYGAVIVNVKGKEIAQGYNGAPKGMPHCIDKDVCYREIENIPKGQGYEKCKSIHAEMNALLQAGEKADGCNLYLYGMDAKTKEEITPFPCTICAKLMINAGIKYVILNTEDGVKRYTPKTILEIREKEFRSD